jgi:hypothetical protein
VIFFHWNFSNQRYHREVKCHGTTVIHWETAPLRITPVPQNHCECPLNVILQLTLHWMFWSWWLLLVWETSAPHEISLLIPSAPCWIWAPPAAWECSLFIRNADCWPWVPTCPEHIQLAQNAPCCISPTV